MAQQNVETAAYATGSPFRDPEDVVGELMTSREVMAHAGLDWSVEKRPLFARLSDEDEDPRYTPNAADTRFGLVRDTDSKMLGICGTRYAPLQNVEALDFADGLLKDGVMRYEMAMALHGGRKVVALARMGEDYMIGDDHYTNYMLFKWGHDGGQAVQVFPTNVRMECSNMLTMATNTAKGKKNFISIAHDSRMEARLAAASKALQITTEVQRRTAQFLERALTIKVDPEKDVAAIVEDIFGKALDQKDGEYSDRKASGIVRYRAIAEEEIKRTGPNLYSLIQGMTGYADWGTPKVQKDMGAHVEWVVDGSGLWIKRTNMPKLLERFGLEKELVLA